MPEDLTRLLERWRGGDTSAEDELFDRVYPNLRALAANRLRRAGGVAQLQTTELANDVYLRLAQQDRAEWKNREQFFAIAARLTRRAIIDFVRHQKRQKRGGDWQQVTLSDVPDSRLPITDILALDSCLQELTDVDELAGQVVEMRYFADLSVAEVALGLGVSQRTVARRWRFARAWLQQCLEPDASNGG